MEAGITTEDLLEVARGVFGNKYEITSGRILDCDMSGFYNDGVHIKYDSAWEYFNPLTSDADAFKVLEALLKNQHGLLLSVWNDSIDDTELFCFEDISKKTEPPFGRHPELNEPTENLRTAIVKAYLSLLRG